MDLLEDWKMPLLNFVMIYIFYKTLVSQDVSIG